MQQALRRLPTRRRHAEGVERELRVIRSLIVHPTMAREHSSRGP